MLTFTCPHCAVLAQETELTPGGAAQIPRAGPGSSDAEFEAYLVLRDNPRGPHLERWRHAYGCGRWFIAARCTQSNRVFGTWRVQDVMPFEVSERLRAQSSGSEGRP